LIYYTIFIKINQVSEIIFAHEEAPRGILDSFEKDARWGFFDSLFIRKENELIFDVTEVLQTCLDDAVSSVRRLPHLLSRRYNDGVNVVVIDKVHRCFPVSYNPLAGVASGNLNETVLILRGSQVACAHACLPMILNNDSVLFVQPEVPKPFCFSAQHVIEALKGDPVAIFELDSR